MSRLGAHLLTHTLALWRYLPGLDGTRSPIKSWVFIRHVSGSLQPPTALRMAGITSESAMEAADREEQGSRSRFYSNAEPEPGDIRIGDELRSAKRRWDVVRVGDEAGRGEIVSCLLRERKEVAT